MSQNEPVRHPDDPAPPAAEETAASAEVPGSPADTVPSAPADADQAPAPPQAAYLPGAAPVGAAHPPPGFQPVPAKPGSARLGTVAAVVAAMLVVTLASGLFGGWAATRFDSDTTSPISSGGKQAPDIDRSSLAKVVEKVQPSVVSVATGSGEGSGVVLNTDGNVLTNNHVVAGAEGDTVKVTFSDGETRQAKIVGTDPRSDLAVLEVDGASGLTPAVFGDSDAASVGDTVLALGSPLGLEGSVTSGIVSAKDRTIRAGDQRSGATSISGMLQTDAAINPGNSGGPLVNLAGEVIGINTAIATSGSGAGNIGVGFAIPSNTAKRVAEQLIKGEQVSHPYLGVEVADADGKGALLQTVAAESPAAQAGLRRGDVITAFGGQSVTSADDLVSAVQGRTVGDRVNVTYQRNGSERQATVTLGEAPAD